MEFDGRPKPRDLPVSRRAPAGAGPVLERRQRGTRRRMDARRDLSDVLGDGRRPGPEERLPRSAVRPGSHDCTSDLAREYAPHLPAPCVVPGLSLIHISEPTRLGMISYAVFCLKKK